MILLAVETQNLSYVVINSGTSWSENSSAIISSNICFCYPKLMLEMLNLSQLGNMLFVAPAIVDESSWIEETQQNVLAQPFVASVQLSEKREMRWGRRNRSAAVT